MDLNNYQDKLYNRLAKTTIEHLASDIKTLADTVPMMNNSNDYKERFRAEYYQLKIRLDNLNIFLEKWDKGEIKIINSRVCCFICQREIYNRQVKAMNDYLTVLKARACIEGICL